MAVPLAKLGFNRFFRHAGKRYGVFSALMGESRELLIARFDDYRAVPVVAFRPNVRLELMVCDDFRNDPKLAGSWKPILDGAGKPILISGLEALNGGYSASGTLPTERGDLVVGAPPQLIKLTGVDARGVPQYDWKGYKIPAKLEVGSCCKTVLNRYQSNGVVRYVATSTDDRAAITIEAVFDGQRMVIRLAVAVPFSGVALPMCGLELRIENIVISGGAQYVAAHPYGGRTLSQGLLTGVQVPGIPFIHGTIGLGIPWVSIYEPQANQGLEFEFMLDQRPTAWLRPGCDCQHINWAVVWTPDRLLEPGCVHAIGGELAIRGFGGDPVAQLRCWRDGAAARGFIAPTVPQWLRHSNWIEFNMNPTNTDKGFTRLDDPKCLEMLKRWKDMGYNAIWAVSPNHVVLNFLSPLDYEPCDAVGGMEAERTCLRWMHELGFRVTLWVTTVGIDRNSPLVKEHSEWFTHRRNGELFYAWDSGLDNHFVGYAPDADPLSSGWRLWLMDQVRSVLARGYDGINIDGCIPRASNHARSGWPGETRNAVEGLVRNLNALVRSIDPQMIMTNEDGGFVSQMHTDMVMGRYTAMPPYRQKAFWDHGMGGGPHCGVSAPERIVPEEARDYLRIKYASLLPGVLCMDIAEGYYCEQHRPWTVEMLLMGMSFKTHSQYVEPTEGFHLIGDAATVEVPTEDKLPQRRDRGREEFLQLVRLLRDEPLLRNAPRSIEGVAVLGDAAVVGILRPSADRCLLGLLQFAPRAAKVEALLTPADDVPACERQGCGTICEGTWICHELMRSMVDDAESEARQTISASHSLKTTVQAYGFRIYELRRVIGQT